jgi:RNA polymerase sigma-70 factor (ECF subfamily)
VNSEPRDFAEFFNSTKDGCYRAVLASVGSREVAEDLVSEAFARAWASWPKVSRHPEPRAWVMRTALNARASWWRRHRREVDLPSGDAGGGVSDGNVHEPPDQKVMDAILRLPPRQRQVVGLRLFLDLDTAGTAKALGIAPGTVKAHLARAITTLRGELVPISTEDQQ